MDTGNTHGHYVLDEQVGFVLRRAHQRHMTIFAERMDSLTPQQFSTLYRLALSKAPLSQNALGRSVAMDAATTKGVVNRLEARGLIVTEKDKEDRRRYLLSATEAGKALIAECVPVVRSITEETLKPLTEAERRTLLALLDKIS
ncbi:MAG: winged helix-turn-helix transcriptional regulator [Rhodobacteraceae bacterium]|uniref:MarR family winged helix-turn-helix transcriptional regulator n=1 Tax=uncultured Celeribacter sp. TaxID=1303376 RepID=UPI0014304DD7|nr:winged helix-turn-helix transcriptional regulator [Celeribacter sp. HF31]NVK47848.1 winged helix-turn-helix transcriptional regulator [Paracoccaceae bacterium]